MLTNMQFDNQECIRAPGLHHMHCKNTKGFFSKSQMVC